MEIEGDDQRDGYALTKGMVPRGVARALIARLRTDLSPGPITPQPHTSPEILRGPAFDGAGEPLPVNFTFAESPQR